VSPIHAFCSKNIYKKNAAKLKCIALFKQMLVQIIELSDEGMHKTI